MHWTQCWNDAGSGGEHVSSDRVYPADRGYDANEWDADATRVFKESGEVLTPVNFECRSYY